MPKLIEYPVGYIRNDMSEGQLIEFLARFLRYEVSFPDTSECQLDDFWNEHLEDAICVRYNGPDFTEEDYYEFQEKLRNNVQFMEATREFTERTRLEIHI